jgi:hypothetical protein
MPQIGYWTPKEIAGELRLTSRFILQIINEELPGHRITAVKISGHWMIEDSEARRFIKAYSSGEASREKEFYSPNDIATAIGKSRPYVLDALTGYGGRKEPRLAGEKRGDRWVIGKEEGDRFIGEHKPLKERKSLTDKDLDN